MWEEDDSVSVISGKMIVTLVDSLDRTVGAICTVKTSLKGPHHTAKIAGHGEIGCAVPCLQNVATCICTCSSTYMYILQGQRST